MRSVGTFRTKSIIPDSRPWTEGKELIKATKVKASSRVGSMTVPSSNSVIVSLCDTTYTEIRATSSYFSPPSAALSL